MAIHIESLKIEHFRGIHGLELENLNHLNIIAGDNNCGKTSVLEALLLLRNPNDFTNILRIARMRDMASYYSGISLYESFINLFPGDVGNKELAIEAVCCNQKIGCSLSGGQKKILMDPDDVLKKMNPGKRYRMKRNIGAELIEVAVFSGQLTHMLYGQKKITPVEIDAYATTTGREVSQNNVLHMVYVSPTDHVRGYVFDSIIRNAAYKEICLKILQMFDAEIEDLIILKNEDNEFSTEYIRHEKLGNMPLSTYGDGIKKVLSLANAIAQAAGGVLLIDEVETAIHAKYYDDIFRFIVKAALQFNVQVFITTHSMEAIDALLATQDYTKQIERDEFSVLTLKKSGIDGKTYSRVLRGRHVYANREQFGFEVRL